MRQTRLF